MYCPECGGFVDDGVCRDCKKEMSKELLALDSIKEINKNDKKAAIASYLLWPVIFALKYEDKKMVDFHKNQGFTLFIVEILSFLSLLIPSIGKFVGLGLIICCGLLAYKGVSNVIHEETEKLPVIGDYTFLKN